MPITTTVAPLYRAQKLLVAFLCIVFGFWGVYDYVWAIPAQQSRYDRYEQLKTELESLESRKLEHLQRGTRPSQSEIDDFNRVSAALTALAPGGSPPVKVNKWNRATQWFFISCLPFTFYFFWLYKKAKRQVYRLDESGVLHFEGDPVLNSGAWRLDDIADIDMERWMSKSIAHAVHRDGRRLKLDAYLHKNLDLIIGALASRLHPEKWDQQAKRVKAGDGTDSDQDAESADEPSPPVAA
ncbi:MAG: hypothetical protein L0Y44_08065 [Phycisphaerales bacterium]|nr:hypothetical protein [Phycisphaerales bacterium]MCI0630590.1 hypothetical protein [Phycisphaerales bacterium]MCI0675291.1 hypothetical protein [Phycisphaerales bacterium]